MPLPAADRRQARFGPFTVDFETRELRNGEIKVRLQGVPFQILTILLDRHGKWVTRDELRQQLWSPDVFVDFEHSINTAIVKLRRALGDSAEKPLYIETLPRHGYRLIARLEETGRSVDRVGKRIWIRRWIVPGAILLLAVAIGARLLLPVRHTAALTSKDTIVLADFDNSTGDSVFDDTLKQALAVELEQSPFLNVLSDQKASSTLELMGRSARQRIDVDVGRELCVRAGSKALLTGSISRMGSHYVVGLIAIACSSGDTLAREQAEAPAKEDVLRTLSQTSSKMRAKLGEALPTVERFDFPIDATTSSLEALKNFSAGIAVRHREGDAPSIPLLKKAVELDPNFPLAYAELALAYDNLREPTLALEYAAKAYRLRDHATQEERLNIAAFYFNATGELDREIQTYELWTGEYPNSAVPHANLGADYSLLGQNDKARGEFEKSLHLAPDVVNVYSGLAATYLFLERIGDAKKILNTALELKLDDGELRQFIYHIAFLENDAAKMEQQVAWAAGKPGDEDALLSIQSDTEAYFGRMRKARDFSERAVSSAVNADSKEAAALWRVNAALREAEIGNFALAKQYAASALAMSSGRDIKVNAALALARAGDASRAKALVEELKRDYPAHTVLKLYWLPTINAAIALDNGDASHALVLLDAAMPYELAEGLSLYPAYLRGQAYMLAHNGTSAAREFQKIVDHRGLVENFITGSLAHLQLGRACAMAGNRDKAKAEYDDFLGLWRNADSGLSALNQAKKEHAMLR